MNHLSHQASWWVPAVAGLAAFSLVTGTGWAANVVPNPLFRGTGGHRQGTTGQVPDAWRAFAVGGGAAETAIVPLAASEVYAGSPACFAVRLKVTAYGRDQGFDHDGARFEVTPGTSYHLEFYVKSGNADGSAQKFRYGFPLFAGAYLGREPGGKIGVTADGSWKKITGPTFSDAQATSAHVSFRLEADGGEDAILIALPVVGDPPERFAPQPAEELAQRKSWAAAQRLVATTYFYWYRWPDLHFFDDAQHTDDALTDHFVAPATVSMQSKAWHKKEVSDMIDARLDMLWPVYWAAPGNFDSSTYSLFVTGLVPLQQAIDELIAEGRTPPRIGMFYDTSTLLNALRGAQPSDGKADLTTTEGKEVFYGTIRSFYATIHPRHWACIDGHPVVVLYASGFATNYDQSSIDDMKTRFAADFSGITPYVIRERSWHVVTDSDYRWGAALGGPFLDGIASVGPGYDDIAVPRAVRHFRDRERGDFYRSSWQQVINSGRRIVHVETWNELHEGTEICETVEYGRQYIDLTREWAGRFRALRVTGMEPTPGTRLTASPTGVVLGFDAPVDPMTVNASTCILTGAGVDALFGTSDDWVVTNGVLSISSEQLALDLTGTQLPEQSYRIMLRGTGTATVNDLSARPLFGRFDGTFPTGNDDLPGDFQATFIVGHPFAKADFDEDDDVDMEDFALFQLCLSGPGAEQSAPQCLRARFDDDSDVDHLDLHLFIRCMSGQGVVPLPDCIR